MTAKPNILILMVDQLAGPFFPDGPADFLHAPNLKALAERSTRFANAYTGSPLCAPGRASFMAGQLPRRTRVYDNAAEFASDIPTFAHHLRIAGYQTTLSGKMHFVGPDQLHGFEERLTTDVYPADFGWTPDYRKPGERIDWWYHNMGSVTGSGIGEISNQLEYDDEVAYESVRKIYDLGRRGDPRPWLLTVSFTHPHDPYVARKKYWDLYEGCDHLDPTVPAIDYADHDAHSRRIFDANDWRSFDITTEDIRRSRRAYFANISYLDDKIGQILEALDGTDQTQDTIILFVSDHGDMLGERGLWFKMSFFEGSSRVPLMVAAPQMAPGRIDTPVSTMDVTPTIADLVGIDLGDGYQCGSSTRPKRRWHRWWRSATVGSSTSTARSIRRCCSISMPTPTSAATWPTTRPTPTPPRRWPRRCARSGTWMPTTRRSARARPGATSFTPRCATAPTIRGTSNP